MTANPGENKESEGTSGRVEDSGAIAQGSGAVAAGEGGVAIGRDVHGDIHIGDKIIYQGIKPVSAGDLLDACREQVNSVLYDARRKYDPNLYVHRAIERELNRFFDTPLDGLAPNCFLIVAPAGSGKTNLLCQLASERVTRQPVLLLMGGSTDLSGSSRLLGAVQSELEAASSEVAFRSAEDSLHTLHRLAEEINQDALLILDAINEHHSPDEMFRALEDLLRKTRGRRIKLVITCRDYYWGLFKGEFWEGATVNALPAQDGDDESVDPQEGFYRFAEDEFEKALDLYLTHYKITGRPGDDVARQCHHPLLLLFFCEAYQKQDVSEVKELVLKDLFRLYWDRKLTSIADLMRKQRAPGDALLGEKEYKDNVASFLLNIASYMLHNNTRSIPQQEICEVGGCDRSPGDRRSVYGRIRDEFIILEEKERGKGQQKLLQVAFVYEEFMEYVMARSLMRDWGADGLTEQAIQAEIAALIDKYGEFAQILGVMVYLALMLKEDRDLALWSLLLSSGEEWQKVIFGAFRQLPEGQIDEGVLGVLEEMLATGQEDVRVQVLDTLKIQRIGSKAPMSLVDAVCELAACDQEKIARRAVLALGNAGATGRVLPALDGALRHPRVSVQENAFKALAKIGEPAIESLIAVLRNENCWGYGLAIEALRQIGEPAEERFLTALYGTEQYRWKATRVLGHIWQMEDLIKLGDGNRDVRERAAKALGKVADPRAVEPLIAALRDEGSGVRGSAAEALGRISNPRAVEPLIAALRDEDWLVRHWAARALGKVGDPRAVKPLIRVLEDEKGATCEIAAEALGNIGTPEALAALEDWERKQEGGPDA